MHLNADVNITYTYKKTSQHMHLKKQILFRQVSRKPFSQHLCSFLFITQCHLSDFTIQMVHINFPFLFTHDLVINYL